MGANGGNVRTLLCLSSRYEPYGALSKFRVNGTNLNVIPGVILDSVEQLTTREKVTFQFDKAILPKGSNASFTDEEALTKIRALIESGEVQAVLVHDEQGSALPIIDAIPKEFRKNCVILAKNRDPKVQAAFAERGVENVATFVVPGGFESRVKSALNWSHAH